MITKIFVTFYGESFNWGNASCFCEKDRHGMLYSYSIDILEWISNSEFGYFKFIFKEPHWWNVCSTSSHNRNNNKKIYLPFSKGNAFSEWLASFVITIRGFIFHSSKALLSMNEWYLLIFAHRVSSENLSLQYMNSTNCMVKFWSKYESGSLRYGNPLTHNMVGLNLALQWHL